LQVILKGGTSEEKAPFGFDFQKSLITLRLEVFQDVAFVEDATLRWMVSLMFKGAFVSDLHPILYGGKISYRHLPERDYK